MKEEGTAKVRWEYGFRNFYDSTHIDHAVNPVQATRASKVEQEWWPFNVQQNLSLRLSLSE
jgi:hypothetical protein